MVRRALPIIGLGLLVAGAWFVGMARQSVSATTPAAITASADDRAAPPCRVLLLGKTGKPLASRETHVSTLIAGSRMEGASTTSDARGVIDLGTFRATQHEILRTHGDRVTWRIHAAEQEAEVDLRACGERPIRVTLPVRPLTIAGHFVNARGERVRSPFDLFPAALHPYLPQDHRWWGVQIRVYDDQNQLLANALRVDGRGAFVVDADRLGPMRFELIGAAGYRLVSGRVDVGPRHEIAVAVEAKPHTLFGTIRDAVDGTELTKSIMVQTDEGTFTDVSRSRYAVFFERPGTKRITVSDSRYQNRYLAESVELDIASAAQRRDFALRPIAHGPSSLRVRVEIAGVEVTEPVSLYVRGEGFTTNEYAAKNAFDVVVPRAGTYAVGLLSQFYAAEEMRVDVDRDETVRVVAREKRTRVIVRVVGPDGQPVRFPPVRQIHEAPINTVSLEEAMPRPRRYGGVYASSFIGGVDSALRPGDEGRVEFRLARGGDYRLIADFEEFERLEQPIRLTTDETTEVTLALVRRRAGSAKTTVE